MPRHFGPPAMLCALPKLVRRIGNRACRLAFSSALRGRLDSLDTVISRRCQDRRETCVRLLVAVLLSIGDICKDILKLAVPQPIRAVCSVGLGMRSLLTGRTVHGAAQAARKVGAGPAHAARRHGRPPRVRRGPRCRPAGRRRRASDAGACAVPPSTAIRFCKYRQESMRLLQMCIPLAQLSTVCCGSAHVHGGSEVSAGINLAWGVHKGLHACRGGQSFLSSSTRL